jgi:uncharacterized damage-inducible protein DinB
LERWQGYRVINTPLAEMLRYNQWATRTLIEACRMLSDDNLDARMPGVSGSVRELLVHLVGAQQTLALRTKGRQHEGELSRWSDWPGFDALLNLAGQSSEDLIAIAEGLDADRDVDLPFLGKVYRFPASFFLVHAMAHGVEHRTEIKVALGQRGIETPDLDGWSYATAAGFGREV